MLVPVLLCGGSGTRLWPVSRKSHPKQFLRLIDKELSLLQMTAQRLNNIKVKRSGWIVVCNEDHRFLVAEQLEKINIDVHLIILEPIGKNTAPAITLAAIEALKISPDAKLLVQTADHFIPDTKYFVDLVEAALLAKQPMMTFGVLPTRPETGYGYIEVGQEINQSGTFTVKRFIEKPTLDKAKDFVSRGKYLWNSGMFLLDAKVYLNELKLFNPLINKACQAAIDYAVEDLSIFLRVDNKKFKACPSISIDYAVMENSDKVSVMHFESKWFDIGAWDAVMDQLKSDNNGNVIVGDGLAQNTVDTFIHSEGRLVTTLGVSNLVVVETPDVVLVASRDATQDVKKIIDLLRSLRREEADEHLVIYRPWGNYLRVYWGDGFQIKKIIVKPGKSLSLQSHKYRSEHWVVIQGVANVLNGDEKIMLYENQSTYIAAGIKHRLANPGLTNLILIEVQTGSYLGEDDILRYQDDFGRV